LYVDVVRCLLRESLDAIFTFMAQIFDTKSIIFSALYALE